jgi:hypothetical protein
MSLGLASTSSQKDVHPVHAFLEQWKNEMASNNNNKSLGELKNSSAVQAGNLSATPYEHIHQLPNGSTIKKSFVFHWKGTPEEFDQLKSSNPEGLIQRPNESRDANRAGAKLLLIKSTVSHWANGVDSPIFAHVNGQPVNHEVMVGSSELSPSHSSHLNVGTDHSFVIPPTGGKSQPANLILYDRKNPTDIDTPLKWVGFSFDELRKEIIKKMNGNVVLLRNNPSKPSVYLNTLHILSEAGAIPQPVIQSVQIGRDRGDGVEDAFLVSADDIALVEKHLKESQNDASLANPNDVSVGISPMTKTGSWTETNHSSLIGSGIDLVSQGFSSAPKQIMLQIENEYMVLNKNNMMI